MGRTLTERRGKQGINSLTTNIPTFLSFLGHLQGLVYTMRIWELSQDCCPGVANWITRYIRLGDLVFICSCLYTQVTLLVLTRGGLAIGATTKSPREQHTL